MLSPFKKRLLLDVIFVALVSCISNVSICSTFPTNQRNDPYPPYTSLDPQDYLYRHERELLKELTPITTRPPKFGISLSAFIQRACKARIPSPTACPDPIDVEIGDIDGRWGMIPLMFGPTPQGQTFPPILIAAKNVFFPGGPVVAEDPPAVDPLQQFGYFSIPIEYIKRGARLDLQAQLFCDIGLEIQAGFSDIRQWPTFMDQTPTVTGSFSCDNPNFTTDNVKCFLMKPYKEIADQIGLNICPFHTTSIEDIKAGLYWRHTYVVNEQRPDFPLFLCIPFFAVQGSFATAKEKNPSVAFALPFGNNGHNAVSAKGGINIDFAETIEVGGEMGGTHFFCHDFNCFRVPTSIYQTGIFPFATSVNIQPGNSWYAGFKMSAYHFLGNLSFWGEYIYVDHRKDCITLKNPDPAFLPEVLECISDWQSQMVNAAFNYDISPNISLGALVQIPVAQRRAYRSSTVMLSFNAQF